MGGYACLHRLLCSYKKIFYHENLTLKTKISDFENRPLTVCHTLCYLMRGIISFEFSKFTQILKMSDKSIFLRIICYRCVIKIFKG